MMDSDISKKKSEQSLSKLKELLHRRLPPAQAANLEQFVGRFFAFSPDDELAERPLEALYGATVSSWGFLEKYNGQGAKIQVFNPDLEQHGWHSNHTVIQILSKNTPFIVDSIRMELNRQNIGIHVIQNVVVQAVRDGEQIRQLAVPHEQGAAESLVYLEVDRHTEPELLKSLKAELTTTLSAVAISVDDFQAMKGTAQACSQRLAEQGLDEERAFFDWLLDDHFTFLGCDAIKIEQGVSKVVPDSVMGQLKAANLVQLGSTQMPDKPLIIARHDQRSRVHRPVYLDIIILGQFNEQNECTGAIRFVGLYTSPVYTERPPRIPLIRQKVANVLARSGFDPKGHSGKSLAQVLVDLPRSELFLASEEELYEMAMRVFNLQERRRARLLVRGDKSGRFYSCLYYVPRDLFSTSLRLSIQNLLVSTFKAQDIEFTNWFSESIFSRTHFLLRVEPGQPMPDLEQLEAEVRELSRSWGDDLQHALIESCGEEQGTTRANLYHDAFPAAYRDSFTALHGVQDIAKMEALSEDQPLGMSFYRLLEQSESVLRFKLFTAEEPLVLSDVIPVLENLGLRVQGEHPYTVRRNDKVYWIHDFTLSHYDDEPVELDEVKEIFQQAFAATWKGLADNDEFNRLVLSAGLSWREVAMLRAYARYNRQIRFGHSQAYIADTLARHTYLTKLLVALFKARFEPLRQTSGKVSALAERIESSILDGLDKVDNLNDDKILRRYLELIKATLRTNYFQTDKNGQVKPYTSYKLNPHAIADIPQPRPMFEVFVYSPRIEGVHLRGGKVARGGLRWSDRLEDYRTEVLGLVKAQQVKNAVIVPVGAKGGFVAKCLPASGSRDEFMAEGIACYQTFIRGLLDLADDLRGGEVIPPESVVRHDEDDPYLVVAADKGTATFSDIANEIAEEYGFWLGDAFASGGSQGYDHKGMGITARGAWESVKLHFREKGLNTQTDPFTVVGIGDMAGDVFGNGMLLSDKIRLVAAFNHMHIFIDPSPDEAVGFTERQRLFALPRSSWEDYNTSLISTGGGVFSRAAKSIAISPQMKQCFDIREDKLSPNELITALLKAPVDLLWNGGIGTYVKASDETHADVGDKANDSLRVNGRDLRCQVVGEGGNLGLTQLGRIEYCQYGGACNTDFIDNAGGVDCSDHEVNIKILLNERIADGDLTVKQRNILLREMTDTVAGQVLQSNDRQARAISLALTHASLSQDEYLRLIHRLEEEGRLDRELEFLPDDEELEQRQQEGEGLTRPELSVLISYTKAELKELLVHSWLTEDPYVKNEIKQAFPEQLVERFPEAVANHQLSKEIIATQVANAMVNHMGITFTNRMMETTGQSADQVAVAYLIARDVFHFREVWADIETLDNRIPASLQQSMMVDLLRLMRRACYWLLRNVCNRGSFDVQAVIDRFKPDITHIRSSISDLLSGDLKARWLDQQQALIDAGVPDEVASRVACSERLYTGLAISEVADEVERSLMETAEVYYALGERLQLDWVSEQILLIEPENHWQLLAREGFNEDLNIQQRGLTRSVMKSDSELSGQALAQEWLSRHGAGLKRWERMLENLHSAANADSATFTVVIRELTELSKRL